MSASSSPGCDASISWRCSSARSAWVAATTPRTSEVLVAVRLRQVGVQLGEELTVLALAQGLVDVVLAAGEQAVDGRSGAPGLGGDVVDRDLGHPPALAARLHGIEHPIFERRSTHEASVSHT